MEPQYPGQHDLKPHEAFVIDMVTYLVDSFDGIFVSSKTDDRGTLVSLSVPDRELGRLIGKKGVTIEALKTLLRAYGQRRDMRLALKLIPADNEAL